MKKTYCTPELNVSHLEPRDVLCTSIVSVNLTTSTTPTISGETPPIAMTDSK